ncbi:MAG: hypothetical protein J7K46_01970 [Bacteroidales bacterium]|nr:hypothetical protein [Bacteroidales bacterium]
MKKTSKPAAIIYLIDELKHQHEELRQQYGNPEKYRFLYFNSEQHFLEEVRKNPPPFNVPRILIFVVNRHLNTDSPVKEVTSLLQRLNQVSRGIEPIIITTQKTPETERKLKEAGALAVITDNENAMLRIDNLVKGSISKHTIWKKRKASKLTFRVLILYLFISLVFLTIAYFLFPDYF